MGYKKFLKNSLLLVAMEASGAFGRSPYQALLDLAEALHKMGFRDMDEALKIDLSGAAGSLTKDMVKMVSSPSPPEDNNPFEGLGNLGKFQGAMMVKVQKGPDGQIHYTTGDSCDASKFMEALGKSIKDGSEDSFAAFLNMLMKHNGDKKKKSGPGNTGGTIDGN